MNHIVIVGGGAAGWLTALTLQKIFKHTSNKVTLIESDEINILGAGEGSVPKLTGFLFNTLELPVNEFIKETNSVFKYGISFENWNGDGEKYFHPFTGYTELKTINELLNQNQRLIEHPFPQYAYKGISPFGKNKHTDKWENFMGHSHHFDAHLVAKFLRKHALLRGVNRVEGKVRGVETDIKNNIKKIILEDNSTVHSTFVFDCSGFHRLLIGKHYNTRWLSYQDYLPVKAALPFQLPQDEHILPYTHAIAMKFGWMWKIPLQNRFGCGYVFDTDYITPEQAKLEVEEVLQCDVEVPRVLSFNAGRYEKVSVNNCIGIGLSVGFTEPIEATSILISILLLTKTARVLQKILKNDQSARDELNDYAQEINEATVPFLYAHYLTRRDDSLFWKEFRHKNKPPELVQDVLMRQQYLTVEDDNYINTNPMFTTTNWVWVMEGLGLLNKSLYPKNNSYLPDSPYLKFNNYNTFTVREFLNKLETIPLLKIEPPRD